MIVKALRSKPCPVSVLFGPRVQVWELDSKKVEYNQQAQVLTEKASHMIEGKRKGITLPFPSGSNVIGYANYRDAIGVLLQ